MQYPALVEPLEPTLFTVPPMSQWFVPTNQPLFPVKRHPHNLGWYDKPLEEADFVVITVPELITIVSDPPPKRGNRLGDYGWFCSPGNPRLFGTSIAQYLTGTARLGGVDYAYHVPFHNLQASAAPTVNDDGIANYSPGSLWVDKTNENTYICIRSTPGAAVWVQLD